MITSKTKRAFEVKQKTLFLVSQVLSFKQIKQTSKNVSDATFKNKKRYVIIPVGVNKSVENMVAYSDFLGLDGYVQLEITKTPY